MVSEPSPTTELMGILESHLQRDQESMAISLLGGNSVCKHLRSVKKSGLCFPLAVVQR